MKSIFLFAFTLITSLGLTQQFNFVASKNFGTSGLTGFGDAIRFDDGTTIFVGQIANSDHDHTGPVYGNYDFWIVKTDANDNIVWEKVFGGSGDDIPYSIIRNSQNEIFVIGSSDSPISGTKTVAGYGGRDIWVLKIDSSGNQLNEAVFGTTQNEDVYSFCATSGINGEILIAATSGGGIEGNKTSPNYGSLDVWMLKLDHNCTKLAETSFGGSDIESNAKITFDHSNKLIVTSSSYSGISGLKTLANYGFVNTWIVALNYSFQILNQNVYGGTDMDFNYGGIFDNENFYLSISSSSPVSGNKTCEKFGDWDAVILKIDTSSLAIQVQQSFGGSGNSTIDQIASTANGFIGFGYADGPSNPFKTNASLGASDVWLLGLTENLDPIWNTTFGGNNIDGDDRMTVFSQPGTLEIYSDFRSSSYTGTMGCANYGTENIFHYQLSTDLSINEINLDDNDIQLFPNPALNYIQVISSKPLTEYTIIDLTGKSILAGKNPSYIDISGVSPGNYLLQMGSTSHRFVKSE